MSLNHVQLAELQIDPAQLEAYSAALREQIQTAIRVEPGVLALQAVAHKDDPARISVFEISRIATLTGRISKRRTSRSTTQRPRRW
jgi:hypothetical protein